MQFDDRGIFGPDVSFYQADPRQRQFIDFQKMKDWRNEKGQGISFVIMKASQYNYADPAFAVNRVAARSVGLPRAFYHFLDYRGEGKSQAQFYWNLIKDDPGEGPLIVDFEGGSGSFGRLWDFLVELQTISGYPADRIWIYTGYYYWLSHGPETQAQEMAFIPYRLWLASYPNLESEIPLETQIEWIKVPRPWLTSTLWQMGTTVVYGPHLGVLSLELDWNIFNGDRELFKRYWITDYDPNNPVPTEPEPTEPVEGGNMKYAVVWSQGVARRTAPHTGNAIQNTYTGKVYGSGIEVDVIEDNIPDANDPTNPNKTWVKFADGLYGASEYPTSGGVYAVRMVKVEEPDPDPTDPNAEIVKGVLYFKDGTSIELFPEAQG